MLTWIKIRAVRAGLLIAGAAGAALLSAFLFANRAAPDPAEGRRPRIRSHFDHTPVIVGNFVTPHHVTRT
jgi:hypothetical protein